jgi:hypothetical protein
MIYYGNSLSATLPNTLDGLPAHWIAQIHQLCVAGEEGGSTTMVALFLLVGVFVACCHISLTSSYVEKWYKITLRKRLRMLLSLPHWSAPHHG